MNSSYFTDRQDRYLHFNKQPTLTNYMVDFTKTISAFTHRLHPVEGVPTGPESYRTSWSNQQVGPTSFEATAQSTLQALQERWRSKHHEGREGDTVLFPIVQSGVLGIREEERIIGTLFDTLSSSTTQATVDLTSGYFGLYAPYKQAVLASSNDVKWHIVAASPKVGWFPQSMSHYAHVSCPKANGFYGSKGLSGRLPEAYTWLERRFWKAAVNAGKISSSQKTVELNEWEREGWTYHAKGALTLPINKTQETDIWS